MELDNAVPALVELQAKQRLRLGDTHAAQGGQPVFVRKNASLRFRRLLRLAFAATQSDFSETVLCLHRRRSFTGFLFQFHVR
jgi:hypothetical protein